MVSFKDLATKVYPNWCDGCGDFGIWNSLKMAIVQMNLDPKDILIVSGIGCSGKVPYWVKTYGYNGLHGRPVPVATGAKFANHKLNVIVIGGDGDGYSEGGNHFVHGARRNIDICYIVHNNMVYGLTTGQTAPTSHHGFVSKSTPHGVIELEINPIALAIASGATFVARGFAGDMKHLTWLIVEGIKHKGFAIIDVLQPCVTFNHVNTYEFYAARVYKIEDDKSYNPNDKMAAFAKSYEWDSKIPIGIFYREQRATYEDQLPQLKEKPLIEQDISNVDISRLMEEFG